MNYDLVLTAILATIPVYVIIALGWFIRRADWITAVHEGAFMRFALDICYPCLILGSMLGNEKLTSISFSASAIAMGFTEIIVGLSVAWGVAKLIRLKIGAGLRTFALAAGIQNYSFFVIPIIVVLYPLQGDPTMGVLMTHNVGCELAIWTVGIILLSGGTKGLNLGVFLRGPLLAVALGLTLSWTGLSMHVDVPAVMTTLKMLGNCSIPLCVMLFGCMMYDSWKIMDWNWKIVGAGVLSRLVLIPIAILFLAWILPVDPLIKRIMVIQSAIPSAIIPVILAKRFGGRPELATQVLLVTTLASFITLPIWLAIGLRYIAQ